ncbi:Legume lectin domain [Dillenia turbinata]|uniref:Legume lectin domain n=1 Tax=Dillenia turbinata TaxID=194707 RepID=A0AAN8V9F4_9MAGN
MTHSKEKRHPSLLSKQVEVDNQNDALRWDRDSPRNNDTSLTQQFNCSSSSSGFSSSLGFGIALYVHPRIRFLDFSGNATASFAFRFTISIKASPSCSFGDGITFLITSNAGIPEFSPEAEDSFLQLNSTRVSIHLLETSMGIIAEREKESSQCHGGSGGIWQSESFQHLQSSQTP